MSNRIFTHGLKWQLRRLARKIRLNENLNRAKIFGQKLFNIRDVSAAISPRVYTVFDAEHAYNVEKSIEHDC